MATDKILCSAAAICYGFVKGAVMMAASCATALLILAYIEGMLGILLAGASIHATVSMIDKATSKLDAYVIARLTQFVARRANDRRFDVSDAQFSYVSATA